MTVLEIPYATPEMQISITHLAIQVPTPLPYKSIQVVPWRYGPKVYKYGYESRPLVINEPNVTTISGVGGMAQSGRVFAPKNAEPLAKAKGKRLLITLRILLRMPNIRKNHALLRQLPLQRK